MDISVVIATYNRSESLAATLRSLANSQVPAGSLWEVIIVDNNSTDQTRAVVESFIESGQRNVRYLFEPQAGKSVALNTGIREAKGRIIAMTDDDCIVDSKWIASILQEYASDPDLAAIGGRVELYNRMDEPTTVRTSKQRSVVSLAPFEPSSPPIIGCNMAFKREIFDVIGCFDPDFGPGSNHQLIAEDVDVLYRVCKSGLKLVYSPDLLVYHNHGRRKHANWESVNRHYVRGRGAFYCKHVLRKDGAVLKMAYWEAAGVTKSFARKLFSGNIAGREIVLLWNLGIGVIYEFRAYSPKIFHAIMPKIK
jgi:glycosyltransferase involved in cell wall biosynthesis